MTAMDVQPLPSWRQSPAADCAPTIQPGRWLATLLYGRNVDRTAKARARVGLAILAFAAVYSIIAVRLVMFAVAPELFDAYIHQAFIDMKRPVKSGNHYNLCIQRGYRLVMKLIA